VETYIGILGTIAAVILTAFNGWMMMRAGQHQKHLDVLYSRLGALEVLVSGQYLTRSEFRESMRDQTTAILQTIRQVQGQG
jgi:hypothetical protein